MITGIEEMANSLVAPHAGAWIEIRRVLENVVLRVVAPHAGAWIEIVCRPRRYTTKLSRPTRARGLKFLKDCDAMILCAVAPHAGAWIEIAAILEDVRTESVAPHAGAWIEICALAALE